MYSRKVDIAIDIAMRFLGKPYVWGGNDPVAGFDCSGLVIEIFKSVGLLPAQGDWSADGLMNMFKDKVTQTPSEGCLVFYGDGGKATHVEMVISVINKSVLTIGANSGGSGTRTLQDAINQDAYIKIRPIKTNPIMIVNPFWSD